MRYIDINCDMGEDPAAIGDGTQESLMPFLSSVNIACGGHAGDDETMSKTIRQAMKWNLAVGAHPGYPDRENFGRIELNLPAEEIAASVYRQVQRFAALAAAAGALVTHVKPHGAMYNQAVRDAVIAQAIAEGVAMWRRDVVMVGLAGSQMLDVFRDASFPVAGEAFADRRYEADGSLRSRKFADALLLDPEEAARQALRIAEAGEARTICIHGDTPGASRIAEAVALTLRDAGFSRQPLG